MRYKKTKNKEMIKNEISLSILILNVRNFFEYITDEFERHCEINLDVYISWALVVVF